jgi:hypothetical protein
MLTTEAQPAKAEQERSESTASLEAKLLFETPICSTQSGARRLGRCIQFGERSAGTAEISLAIF